MQVGCGGAYHSWTPLYPDKSTTDKVGLLINTYSLLLDPQPVPALGTNGERIRLNLGAWACRLHQRLFILHTQYE